MHFLHGWQGKTDYLERGRECMLSGTGDGSGVGEWSQHNERSGGERTFSVWQCIEVFESEVFAMRFFSRSKVSIVVPFIALLGLLGALMMSGILRAPAIHAAGDSHSGGFYRQTNLVSDIAGLARVHDTNLVNAWGLSHSPTSPWWISD